MEREETVPQTDNRADALADADAPLERDGRDEASTVGGRPDAEAATQAQSEQATLPLLDDEASSDFDRRWREVQAAFVDEPRVAVERADKLVEDLMQRLTQGFAQQREQLEQHWDRGDEVSTEDLRLALTRYRSFFQRLLAA